ncbi:unnamed protein product [Heterobilharzia americana]|nr:unnamed protein product [Heterobilharzia americana]CAH8525350.1 unnamed protein product [Heterobilharzia americana]CAH8525374.1 unnamed protein product [Heterobilharzia americana]CAH8525397.1 unnamed protein product [Heterobilharzia americana]
MLENTPLKHTRLQLQLLVRLLTRREECLHSRRTFSNLKTTCKDSCDVWSKYLYALWRRHSAKLMKIKNGACRNWNEFKAVDAD